MPITRREFVLGGLGAGAAGAAALVFARQSGDSAKPGSPQGSSVVAPAGAATTTTDGILVLLTLYGGNDGLNTVIPYENGSYLGGRSSLGYQPEQVLPIGDGLGLHPNLTGLKALWDAKRLAIVRGVGYPNPNRSHFRSMDIWQSAMPDEQVVTGWVGRWLDGQPADADLAAASLDASVPLHMQGYTRRAAGIPADRDVVEAAIGRQRRQRRRPIPASGD